ncbi:methyltransferase domain-containing protein [Aeromicrobium sp. CnD17-E]|uniref:methyltransferase domain-containing protein n=1 Tax=Aeromicrobium sp. CnD17-E TaxID=2954487 RepID=UPI00209849E6|nr:methyltransferase domain-containing protein [Aeromicrobium sp. CnD17-E]MCO7238945.1 methyltransferase domain-containing protein [Aeromicrobium sp. CnD17-E]
MDEPGEVVVRVRADGATELRVNGVFVMDDVETSSERLLADLVLDLGAREVLVGGLGLGYTAQALLAGDVERLVVAELHADVVAAVRAGAGAGPSVLDDPRCTVEVGDVRDVVAAQPDASLDAVLLDVDNGPDFLVHETNAAVYAADGLADAARVLRPGGTLAVWSMADSAPLRARLAGLLDDVGAVAVPVDLQGRSEDYWVLTGRAR